MQAVATRPLRAMVMISFLIIVPTIALIGTPNLEIQRLLMPAVQFPLTASLAETAKAAPATRRDVGPTTIAPRYRLKGDESAPPSIYADAGRLSAPIPEEVVTARPAADNWQHPPALAAEFREPMPTHDPLEEDLASLPRMSREPPSLEPGSGVVHPDLTSGQVAQLQAELAATGASYMRLESGPSGYLCCCRVPVPGTGDYQREFAAQGRNPSDAMRQILVQVRSWQTQQASRLR